MQSLMKNEMSYEIFFNGGNKLLKSNEKVMEAEATSMDSPGTIEFISDGDKLEIIFSKMPSAGVNFCLRFSK